MLTSSWKIHYIRTLLCDEAFRQLDILYFEVGSTTMIHLNPIILGLGAYFLTINALPKQKCAMHRGMRSPRELKVRCYAPHNIDPNEYLAAFHGAKAHEKISETKMNEIILNSMPNIWSKKLHVQGFYCEYITFKKAKNMFECMEIAESIMKVL